MPARRRILFGSAIGAGTLLSVVNPSGVQTLLFPLGTLISPLIQNNIQEWASPDFHSLPGLLVEGIIFLLLAGLATGRVRARTSEWLLAFALLYLALSSQRHVPLFVLAAAPLMARCAQALLGLASSFLPAVDRPALAQVDLLWRLYPDGGRVFIDGRVEVYGPQVFSRYLRVSYLASGWEDVLAQAQPDAIVLPSAHPLTGILGQDADFRLLSRDEVATVFIRVGF